MGLERLPRRTPGELATQTHTLQSPRYIIFIVRTENYTVCECKTFPVWQMRSQNRKETCKRGSKIGRWVDRWMYRGETLDHAEISLLLMPEKRKKTEVRRDLLYFNFKKLPFLTKPNRMLKMDASTGKGPKQGLNDFHNL